MEVLCDYNLRIWNVNFSTSGSKNDANIMDFSNIFNDIRNKKWPLVLPDCAIEGYDLRAHY